MSDLQQGTEGTAKAAPVPAQPRTRRMRRRLLRIVLISIIIIVVLIVALGGTGAWLIWRTLPQTSGTLQVTGLQQPVVVVRDQWGAPHITAATFHDVAFAQGYVTAQDRLFQMELNRRIAQGRLAETFGAGSDNSLLDSDAFLRALDMYHQAQAELATLDERSKVELQAYADGVNAFINTHRDHLPLEFTILGISAAPWTSLDSLAYGRVVALSLDDTWGTKYLRAMLMAKPGQQIAHMLLPDYPGSNPTLLTAYNQAAPLQSPGFITSASSRSHTSVTEITPSANPAFTHLSVDVLHGAAVIHTLLGNASEPVGSNDWVVDGTRTATGKPLLANDPHLGINMPATWYEVELSGGGLHVIGFSFPGVPGVIIGHNDSIAWGVTNVGADNADLYLETLDPQGHPGQYKYNGQWLPLKIRRETIRMRGAARPVTITITSTGHGPLLNNLESDVRHYKPVSLKWTALQPGYSFAGFFQLDSATNWQQFLSALSHISISQNFVYADIDGNIGYRMSGLLPIRPRENGLVPVDGSTSAHEWQGYVPQAAMPVLFNPPTHIIVTANNQIVPQNAPIYVTASWDYGYRASRINDLLRMKAQLTSADYQRIQADVYSIPAARLTPFFVAAGKNATGDAATAVHLLEGWDYNMTSDSSAASVYEVTVGMLIREIVRPVLGKDLYQLYQDNYTSSGRYTMLINLLTTPSAPFFKGSGQLSAERDKAIVRAMSDAVKYLQATFGTDTSQWHWGKLHQAHFDHPLASVTPLNLIFGVSPVERPGDSVTVDVGGDVDFSSPSPNYQQYTVASMREIIDLSNLDSSLWVITTGQSGQPFSAHFIDLLTLWQQNRYQQMNFSPGVVSKAGGDTLNLTP